MAFVQPVLVPLSMIGSPESTSFWLLIAFIIVFALTLLGLISAFFDMILYAGGTGLVIGGIFYASESLSFAAAWGHITSLVGFL